MLVGRSPRWRGASPPPFAGTRRPLDASIRSAAKAAQGGERGARAAAAPGGGGDADPRARGAAQGDRRGARRSRALHRWRAVAGRHGGTSASPAAARGAPARAGAALVGASRALLTITS